MVLRPYVHRAYVSKLIYVRSVDLMKSVASCDCCHHHGRRYRLLSHGHAADWSQKRKSAWTYVRHNIRNIVYYNNGINSVEIIGNLVFQVSTGKFFILFAVYLISFRAMVCISYTQNIYTNTYLGRCIQLRHVPTASREKWNQDWFKSTHVTKDGMDGSST